MRRLTRLLFPLFLLFSLSSVLRAQAPDDFSKTLTGTVGQYKITMRLDRTGDTLAGSYEYANERARQPQSLELQGKIDRAGNFTLRETDDAGKLTGTFAGRFPAAAPLNLTGTWTKAAGGTKLAFSLAERVFALDDGGAPLRIAMKELKEERKAQKFRGEAHYPQIVNSQDARVLLLNREIEDRVKSSVGGFAKDVAENDPEFLKKLDPEAQISSIDIDAGVVTATGHLLSIFFAESTYSAGAAHPNHNGAVLNYDLQAGRALQLSDLFKPRAAYLARLAQICIGVLKKDGVSDDEWIERGAAPEAENYARWNITPQGLLITFDQYQVASYAEGPKEIIIPYATLKDIIDPAGPAGAFAR